MTAGEREYRKGRGEREMLSETLPPLREVTTCRLQCASLGRRAYTHSTTICDVEITLIRGAAFLSSHSLLLS